MNALALFKATAMLSSDYPTENVDAVFFHARSYGDDDGLWELVEQLYVSGQARWIVINGSDGRRWDGTTPGEAWPGRDAWLDRIDTIKPLKHAVIGISRPALHTREENDAFIEYASEANLKSAIILTQPHQLLRTFLGAVRAMYIQHYWMRLYAVAPKTTSWKKLVRGSQGILQMERFGHIAEEFGRIEQYQKAGSLATFDELEDYLRHRRHKIV